jgi:hypothetical protein
MAFSGTYNECALFVFKAHGILITTAKDASLSVPPGATAKKNDQYSSHMGVIEYMSFTTTVDGLLGELSQQLDALGYTQALHEALMDVKAHMETETVSKGYDAVFLKNTFVTPKPKLVVPPSASGKDESGEKGNSGDSDVNSFLFLKNRAIEPNQENIDDGSPLGRVISISNSIRVWQLSSSTGRSTRDESPESVLG